MIDLDNTTTVVGIIGGGGAFVGGIVSFYFKILGQIKEGKKEQKKEYCDLVLAERARIDELEVRAASFKSKSELQEDYRLIEQRIEHEKNNRLTAQASLHSITDKLVSDLIDSRMEHTRLSTRFENLASDVGEIKTMLREGNADSKRSMEQLGEAVNQLRISIAGQGHHPASK